jgi:phage baseplate assembly protein W
MKQPFTSIHYPIAIDAGPGRLAQETNYAEHVDQLIRQLLLTNPGERINRPDFGCGVKRMIFAPNSKVTAALAQVTIFESLNRWLSPVIIVGDVRVEARDEVLSIWIAYTLRVRLEKRYLNLEVTL